MPSNESGAQGISRVLVPVAPRDESISKAFHGQHSVEQQPRFIRSCDCNDHDDSLKESYLLICAVEGVLKWRWSEKGQSLVLKLLQSGVVNPNLRYQIQDQEFKVQRNGPFGGSTAWQFFLNTIVRGFGGSSKYPSFQKSKALNMAHSFLNAGVDISVSNTFLSTELFRRDYYSSDVYPVLDASVLYILQLLFSDEPGFSKMENSLKYAGAEAHRWISSVVHKGKYDEEVAVGKQDSDRLLPLLEQWEETGNNADKTKFKESMKEILNRNGPIPSKLSEVDESSEVNEPLEELSDSNIRSDVHPQNRSVISSNLSQNRKQLTLAST